VDEGASLGERTRVWAFAHILPGAVIGNDCNICDHTFVEGNVRLADRVTVKCGVYIWDGVVAEDDVFIGPCVAFTNDKRPRSRHYAENWPQTLLKAGCSLGANATILPGITIGRYAMVGAGTVVTRDVPDYGLVYGNPGKFQGWVCRCGNRLSEEKSRLFRCACGKAYALEGDRIIREQV
jgi:acetyltransferase-like isoleucine patch superfamily enzyme